MRTRNRSFEAFVNLKKKIPSNCFSIQRHDRFIASFIIRAVSGLLLRSTAQVHTTPVISHGKTEFVFGGLPSRSSSPMAPSANQGAVLRASKRVNTRMVPKCTAEGDVAPSSHFNDTEIVVGSTGGQALPGSLSEGLPLAPAYECYRPTPNIAHDANEAISRGLLTNSDSAALLNSHPTALGGTESSIFRRRTLVGDGEPHLSSWQGAEGSSSQFGATAVRDGSTSEKVGGLPWPSVRFAFSFSFSDLLT